MKKRISFFIGQKSNTNKNILKFIAFLMAIFMWFYVFNTTKVILDKEFDLIVVPPDGLTLGQEVVKKVNIKIKGPRGFIRSIKDKNERMIVKLEKSNLNNRRQYLFKSTDYPYAFPFGVEILEAKPKFVPMYFVQHLKRKIPVNVETVGRINDQYELVDVIPSIKEVTISGPSFMVRGINSVKTRPIDLTLISENSELVGVFALESPLLTINKAEDLKIKVRVRPKESNLTIEKIPVRFLTSRKVLSSSQKYVSLEVLALKKESELRQDDIQVIADIPDSSSGTVFVDLKANLPDNIKLQKIVPSKIKVKVK